ncbi:MAG: MHYT domain-containing protein [Sneathiellaceae bacterium]
MNFLLDNMFQPLPSDYLVGRGFYVASYDLNLVALSVIVATLAGMVALTIAARLSRVEGRVSRRLWLGAGSVVMAGGIWSMHFIGMLAFSLPCGISYNLPVTLLSTLPALVASFAALEVSSRGTRPGSWRVLLGGLVMGLGIGMMHYTGMAAMRLEAELLYDPSLVLLSVGVAGGLAWASLALNLRLMSGSSGTRVFNLRRLPAALFMGVAVAGMHYTAMAAAIFVPDFSLTVDGLWISPNLLALLITIVTTAVIAATLAIVFGSVQRETATFLREAVRQREAAEKAADERGRRLQAMLDNLAEGIVTISPDGTILHWSPSAERLFGYTSAEVEGRNVSCLMPEPYASAHDGYLAAYRDTGIASIIGVGRKVVGRRKDGSVFPLYLAVGEAELETGTIFTGILRDLSVEEAAQAELRTKEKQLRVALDSMADGLCMVDADCRVVVANGKFGQLMGIPDEMLAPGADSVLPASIAQQRDGTLERRIGDRSIEIQFNRTDDGGYVLLAHDVTHRRQTEEDLRAAKDRAETATQAKSAFLANMSHEIRTPMNSVLGFLSLSLEEPDLPAELRRHLRVADRSARSLLQIINDILDVSKLESGAVSLEQLPLSVSECVRGILDIMSLKAKEKGISLTVELSPDVPAWVVGDPTRLRQILLNLVGNAVKFTEEGRVNVRVAPDAQHAGALRFEVSDTGIGIAQDRLETIFEPFSQEDASTTRRFGGSGLGTTICRQLVDLMGGRIWAESRPGKGSTFTFTLPLKACSPPEEGNWDLAEPWRHRTYAVLVVEDIPENRLLLELRLRRQGHQVFQAADGAEGLSMFRRLSPDIVLMDVHMPVMDGLAATAAIRAAEAALAGEAAGQHPAAGEAARRTPIIALTASVMESDRRRCIGAGMDAVVAKPVDFLQLMPLMDRLIAPEGGAVDGAAWQAPRIGEQAEAPPGLLVLEEVADLRAGLTAWQDEAAYAKALRGFATRVDDWKLVAAALDEGDIRSARAVLHTLKGLAGNLALVPVADAAARFGALLKGIPPDGPAPEQTAPMLEELQLALTATARALAGLPEVETEAVQQPTAGRDEILDALNGLLSALGSDNPDPVEREIRRIGGVIPPAKLDGIARAVEEFDFDRAREQVRRLMAAESAAAAS